MARSKVKKVSDLPSAGSVTLGDVIYVQATGHHYAKNAAGNLQDLGEVSDPITAELAAEQLRAQSAEQNFLPEGATVDTDGTMAANSDAVVPSQKATKTFAMPKSYLDTDGTLAANSDTKVASQKAVKNYADTIAAAAIPATYLDTGATLSANSDTKVASQKATKTYADTKVAGALDTDTALAANSDAKVASQKAVKAYVDAGTFLQKARVTVTAAQIKALKATPKTLIAAPGAGKMLACFGWAVHYVPGTTGYTMPDVDTFLHLYGPATDAPGGAAKLDLVPISASGLTMDALDETVYAFNGNPAFPPTPVVIAAVANKALLLTIATTADAASSGELTLGDGTLDVTVFYAVIDV